MYAQVSQENIPLGPLATLMPLLQMAGVLNDNNIKNALKQVRGGGGGRVDGGKARVGLGDMGSL